MSRHLHAAIAQLGPIHLTYIPPAVDKRLIVLRAVQDGPTAGADSAGTRVCRRKKRRAAGVTGSPVNAALSAGR